MNANEAKAVNSTAGKLMQPTNLSSMPKPRQLQTNHIGAPAMATGVCPCSPWARWPEPGKGEGWRYEVAENVYTKGA